jgi:membrane-associated protein
MDQIREYLLHFSGPSRYIAFFFILGSCCVGFPLNSDLILITASVLAAGSVFDIRFLIPLALLSLLCGDSITYFVGRKFGRDVLNVPILQKVVKPAQLDRAEYFLKTRGNKYLFLVRFLPLVRTALYLTAGCLKVAPRAFYLMDATSTLLYLFMLMGSSYFASAHIDALMELLKKFQFGLLGLVLITGIGLYVFQMQKARKLKA